MDKEIEMTIMQLITHGGDAKSKAITAIRCAKDNNFDEADKYMIEAEEALNRAHEAQTGMIVKELNGTKVEFNLLLTHAQDHLMNAITTIDLAKEIIEQWKTIHSK